MLGCGFAYEAALEHRAARSAARVVNMRTRRPPAGSVTVLSPGGTKDGVAAGGLGLAPRAEHAAAVRVRQQHDVFVDLALAREGGAGRRVGVGDDEVLPARVPGLA